MNSQKLALFVLLLVSFSLAFDVSEYLFEGEDSVSVTSTDFTINATDYSIVALNGQDTFLLKEGEPVTSKSEISDILYIYYKKSYFPSQEELDDLLSHIERFNESRNDGYNWKNKEEYLCRDEILFSSGKITVSGQPVTCKDEESCQKNAMLLFAAYGEGLGLGSVDPLYDGLVEFAIPSFEMDEILGNYVDKIENLNEDNLVESIQYIADNADTLEENALKVEKTIFRTPRLDDEKDKQSCYLKCFAICPSFDLDEDAAADIKDAAEDLADKIAPLSDYVEKSNQLYERSNSRINYSNTEHLAEQYSGDLDDLNQTATSAINLGEEATEHVLDYSLAQKVSRLKQLNAEIPNNIDARDFDSMEEDFSEYKVLLSQVKNESSELLEQYNETRNDKNIANSLLLVLETKDLDPVSSGTLELLKNRSADLDAQFRDGIPIAKYESLEVEYEQLNEDGQQLLKKESDMPATQVLLLFRGFAKNVNSGIANVADESEVIERTEIAENKTFMLGIFSAMLFISMLSIVVLLSLFVLANTQFTIPKSAHIFGAAFAAVFIILLGFSLFTFIFLSKTSSDATLDEYLEDFDKGESTAIIVDLQDTTYADSEAMNECASSLAETVGRMDKDWTIYRLTASQCMKVDSSGSKSLTISECEEAIAAEPSSFELSYSVSNEPPKFSIIYNNKAEINANTDYYESCPLVSLFS